MARRQAPNNTVIYKIAPQSEWAEMAQTGQFLGSEVDLQDGFIHFSTKDQVKETATKHFSGLEDLVLIAIDATLLETHLKWEISRGGARFPHLYSPLKQEAVLWFVPLPLHQDGTHIFPQELVQ